MEKPRIIEAEGRVNAPPIAIVQSKYNSFIVERLIEGCLSTLDMEGVDCDSITIVKVPGAYEIPIAVQQLAERKKFEAIITIGAIIRGETPHFDIIANSCSLSILNLAIEFNLPVIFGVLTVNTMQQAMDRSGEDKSNKGSEAAKTALDMISVMRKLADE